MAQPSFDSILNAVMQAESGGRRYDDRGNLLTSPKGARGEMQVLDTTKFRPGYGVEPARENTPDERARVGRDYLKAMLDRYGDTEKALVAYNWGPGNADKWIARGADPAKLPAETQGYVSKIKSALAGAPRATAQASSQEMPEAAVPAAPAAGAPRAAPRAAPTRVSEAGTADLGASYQAALALSYLADEDERESGRREYDERQPSISSQWLARETARAKPEMFAMPHSSPFVEPEPVRAADGGFIAVGYNQGGEAKTGEWKDGPPPELPPERGVKDLQEELAKLGLPGLPQPVKPPTMMDRLRRGAYTALHTWQDMPKMLVARDIELGLFLANKYNLMPPELQQWMNEERERRQFLREQRMKGYEDGGEVEAVAAKSTEQPSRPEPFRVPPGQMEARLKEFNRLDPATQSLIARDDPRVQFALTPAPASVSAPYTLSTMPGARALYDQTLAGTTTGGYVHPALRMQDRSSLKQIPTQDVVFLRPGRDKSQELQSRAHEAEHLLAKRGLGDATAINDKFDELMKDSRARRAFVEKAVSVQPYLEKTYGTKSTYFMPEMLAFQDKRGRGANLLYEQFAELAAIEQATGKDLTKDPELRKTIFKDKKVREVYNSLTGLRQTRLDARDLSPYTPISEKPEGMMEFIRSRLGFNEGGEVDKASARGMLESLKSGEGAQAFLRGLTMLPQNIVGAPVDLATMALRPLGYNVEKPVMGSEWLKEKSRQAGVAFAEPTDANARALYTAGDIASNLVNPAGATRAAVRGVKEVGEQAGQAARMLRELKPPSGPDLAVAGAGADVAQQAPRKSLEELINAPMLVEGSRRDWERISDAMRLDVREGKPLPVPKETLMQYVQPLKTLEDGLQWVKIRDPRGLILEGGAMDHSINRYANRGSYGHGGLDAIEKGRAEVFSLRDTKTGKPLVTMEVYRYLDNGERRITQIKGPANSDPSQYRKQIFELLDDPKLKVIGVDSQVYKNTPTGGTLPTEHNIYWQSEFDDWKSGLLDYRRKLAED